MKLHWSCVVLLGLCVSAAEVQHAQLGSTVTLSCNISYIYETTWLKQNPEVPPTVVLSAVLKEGQPEQVFQLEPRYTVTLMKRSLGLMITAVQEEDLRLFFCIGKGSTQLMIGTGTVLQNEHVPQFLLQHWYCVLVAFVLLIMVMAVGITHWRARSKERRAAKLYGNLPRDKPTNRQRPQQRL